MDMKTICPCPNLNCPNHGDCEKCTSRHVRKGFLNYCAFHTWLPTLQAVVAKDPQSPAAKKLAGLLDAQLQAYDTLMAEHGLTQDGQAERLRKVAKFSDH